MLISFFEKIKALIVIKPQTAKFIEDFLIYNYYKFLGILFVLLLVFLVLSFRNILREMKKVSTRTWILLILIFNLAMILRFFVLSHHPQVFFDEVTFIETAENYYDSGLNMQNYNGSLRNRFLICTTAWPFLVSLGFKITGVNIKTAFYISALISSLTIFPVFGAGGLIFRNEKAGVWSAFIFSVFPVFMRLSTSSAMGTASIFFVFITLLAFILYFRQRSTPLLYFSFCSLAFTVNIRQEAIMTIFPLFLLFFLIFHRDLKSEFRKPHIYICLLLCLVFAIPPVLASYYGISTGFYFFYEPSEIMRKHIQHNMQFNLIHWIANRIQPLSFILMAAFSFVLYFRKDRRLCIFFAIWFVFLYMFYSINPSCDFSSIRTLDSWRSTFHLLVPIVLFAGLAPVIMIKYFSENYRKLTPLVMVLLIVAVGSTPLQFWKFINKKTIYARENLFIKRFTERLPSNSRIILDGKFRPIVRESYLSLFRYTSGIPGKYYPIDSDRPFSTRRLFRDLHRWKNEDRRPVYLYLAYINSGSLETNYKWYFDTFELIPVGGFGISKYKASFCLYEIVGIKKIPPGIK